MTELNAEATAAWDFGALAAAYAPLQPHLRPISTSTEAAGRYTLNWRDAAAVAALTEAFLAVRCGLRVTVPTTQLIPAVPLRLHYIEWIERLVALRGHTNKSTAVVQGVDIGCGPLAIYALLACQRNPHWRFLCSDIDSLSLQHAQNTLDQNQAVLQSRVELTLQPDPQCVLTHIIPDSMAHIDFCMFNPPFFAAHTEKRSRQDTVCTATQNELVHEHGGEMNLFNTLVKESLSPAFKERVSWFTFMFGIKSHLQSAISHLRHCGIDHVLTTRFEQGKTHRWGIAWTHRPPPTPTAVDSAILSPPKRRKLNPPISQSNQLPKFYDIVLPSCTLSLSQLLVSVEAGLKSTMPHGSQCFVSTPTSSISIQWIDKLDGRATLRLAARLSFLTTDRVSDASRKGLNIIVKLNKVSPFSGKAVGTGALSTGSDEEALATLFLVKKIVETAATLS